MLVLDNINARNDIERYNIQKQYKKACDYIRNNHIAKVQLKLRKPKSLGVYQFRISRKYRALAVKKNNALYVFEISDHQ